MKPNPLLLNPNQPLMVLPEILPLLEQANANSAISDYLKFWYDVEQQDGFLFLRIRGVIGWFAESGELAELFQTIAAMPEVHTVVVSINSPGGLAIGVQEAAEELNKLAGSKRVVAWVEEVCASAAYWVASGATMIYAKPSAMVGSCGAYNSLADSSESWKQDGYKFESVTSAPGKLYAAPGKPFTDEDRAFFQARVDEFAANFEAFVREQRPGLTEDVFAKGEYGSAQRFGAESGLVDGLFNTLPEMLANLMTKSV